MKFIDKVVLITGGARGIGKCIKEMFENEGAHVCTIDLLDNDYFVGDLSSKEILEKYVEKVIKDYGHIDYIINNALPLFKGIDECSYEEFQYALSVGITAPFYLAKLCKPYLNKGACIINISSTRANMSMPQSESYAAAKGGISSLTHALAVSLSGIARVNSIAPGWIDTTNTLYSGPDATQQPVKRVGKVEDIGHLVLFLCSDQAGFITGENITVDGGMSKLMIYHDEHGWTYSGDE